MGFWKQACLFSSRCLKHPIRRASGPLPHTWSPERPATRVTQRISSVASRCGDCADCRRNMCQGWLFRYQVRILGTTGSFVARSLMRIIATCKGRFDGAELCDSQGSGLVGRRICGREAESAPRPGPGTPCATQATLPRARGRSAQQFSCWPRVANWQHPATNRHREPARALALLYGAVWSSRAADRRAWGASRAASVQWCCGRFGAEAPPAPGPDALRRASSRATCRRGD